MFRATMCPLSGETAVFVRHLVLVILSRWGVTLTPHPLLVPWSWKGRAILLLPLWPVPPVQSLIACTRRNSCVYTTLGTCYSVYNKYQVSHEHSCFSWWWAHSLPKHVETDKYTKKTLCTKLDSFTRLYGDARSTKHKCVEYVIIN